MPAITFEKSRTEEARLSALRAYHILDTAPEVAFERITDLVATLLAMPIAMVSLVDEDRQWFKAVSGVELTETPLDYSFCTHAIASNDDVMEVPDTLRDSRFVNHPAVQEPYNIRFYAGAPLTTPEGFKLGTLCVLDVKPRHLSAEQKKVLSSMAAIVMDEVELRRLARELRENETALRDKVREVNLLGSALASTSAGVVITDPSQRDNPIVFANPAFHRITGYPLEEVLGRNCRFLQGEKTNPAMVREMEQCIKNATSFSGVLRNYRKDGSMFYNDLIINPVFDENGDVLSFVGLQNDVTERETQREALRLAKLEVENANRELEERVRARTDELAEAQSETLERLARAGEYRDDDTGQHTQRVGAMAARLAGELGLSEETVRWIQQAARLHDVGKIGISDLILLKPGKLTDDEFELMKTHTTIGAALFDDAGSELIQMARRIALSHHERWDGRGYPYKLSGESIPIEARITAVADVFDALTHDRPYKKAWSIADSVAEIQRQSGSQFDPEIVEIFARIHLGDAADSFEHSVCDDEHSNIDGPVLQTV